MNQTAFFAAALLLLLGNPSQAETFNPDRCGIEYPKKPTGVTTAPTDPFKSTDTFGIVGEYLPMVCRGGGTLVLSQEFYFPGTAGAPTGISHEITFTKATVAAGLKGTALKAGECAWYNKPATSNKFHYATSRGAGKMKLVSKANGTSPTTKELSVEPWEMEALLSNGNAVALYVSPLTGRALPFCDARPNGVYPMPYYQLAP